MNNGEHQDHDEQDEQEEPEQGSMKPTPDSPIQASEEETPDDTEKAASSEDVTADENPPTSTPFIASKVEFPDMARFFPKLPDTSKYFPKLPDTSKYFFNVASPSLAAIAFPKIDVTNWGISPQIDVSKLFGRLPNQDLITGLIGLIDMPKVDFRSLIPNLSKTLEKISEAGPPNWPEEIDLDLAASILNTEGIPLVWVPRAEIITSMLTANDRRARLQILVDHREDVLHDCSEALQRITHISFTDQLPLAERVVAALEAGFDEPAQALAVTVTESAVAATLSGTYKTVKEDVHLNFDQIPYTLMRIQAALAPIGVFYTSWFANQNKPRPEELSRHVSVHAASTDHYTEANALVAVMLMSSVMCALQELQEQEEQQRPDA